MTEKKEGQQQTTEESETEKLIKEKIRLTKKLGLDGETPVDGYRETKEYERIKEIDALLWELI